MGRGEAEAGDEGIVVDLDMDGSLYIDFPSHCSWRGEEHELELVGRGKPPEFELDIDEFPECCTMKVVHSFGGTNTALFTRHVSKDDIIKALEKRVEWAKIRGYAMLVATTNNEQVEANEALKEFGFQHSRWASKRVHPETRVRLWYYYLEAR